MTNEHIQQIAKELTDSMVWMKDSSAGSTDVTLDELIEDSGDIYEVYVDIHLNNGDVVHLRNDCIGGFEKKRYTGAELEEQFRDGNIIAYITTYYDNKYRCIKIPLTSICWIDSYAKDIDWKNYKFIKNMYEGIRL